MSSGIARTSPIDHRVTACSTPTGTPIRIRTRPTQSPAAPPLSQSRPGRRRRRISPFQSPHATSPPPQLDGLHAPATPCSATAHANVGRRRCPPASVLLASPARPGHASRMRHIFGEAATPRALYPQLPNISRVASPPTSGTRPRATRPGIVHQRPNVHAAPSVRIATPTPTSDSSSWSDDSAYIALDQDRSLVGARPPVQPIQDWLSTVSLDLTKTQKHLSTPASCSKTEGDLESEPRALLVRDNFQQVAATQNAPFEAHASLPDPFVIHLRSGAPSTDMPIAPIHSSNSQSAFKSLKHEVNDSTMDGSNTPNAIHAVSPDKTNFKEGDIKLIPLSPNVCVERGRSRHRYRKVARRINYGVEGEPTIT